MPITRCNSAGFQILLGLAILVTSIAMLTPSSGYPFWFWQADKLVHVLVFLVLAFLADAGWPEKPYSPIKYLPLLGYGLAVELLQHYVPTRTTSLADLLADGTGLALYGLLVLPWLRRAQIR